MDTLQTPKKRSGNITIEQKEVMVDFLKQHPNLLRGKFSAEFTKNKAQKLWQQLAQILNSMAGANKEWHQWRKSWHDLRSNTKQKKSVINKYRQGTGGGEPIDEELNPMEETILQIIGTTAVEGHPVTESAVAFAFSQDKEKSDEDDGIMADHSYTYYSGYHNKENVNCNREIGGTSAASNKKDTPTKSELPRPHTENKPPSTSQKTPQKQANNNKPKRVIRLDNTITATATLAEQNTEKIAILREYYDKKLNLMEEDVCVKREIANSLKELVEKLNNIYNKDFFLV